MKLNWIKYFILVLGAAMILSACGSNEDNEQPSSDNETDDTAATESESTEGQTYKIGVTQIVEHPSLNDAFEGFKQAIEDAGLDVEYDVQNAQNDNSANTTIATNLVNSNVDLIFSNSTPSTQAVASATQEIPIVFSTVADPVGAEVVESMEKPGGNVTGNSDTHPEAIEMTLKFLKDELNSENIGMVYNSGEQNARAQVDNVKDLAEDIGVNIVEATISTSSEVKQATESLLGKVDSIYIITDNTVVSALESVIDVANENKLPVITAEYDSVKRGSLAAYGFEYYDIGYESGKMAVKILKGEAKPADIPVQNPQNLKLLMNKNTADEIGLEVKDEWNVEFSE